MRQETPDILGNIMAATLAAAPAATLVPLAAIVNDGGTQMRAGLHAETITEYEEAIRTADAWPFPPVIVFHDGARYWLADGFHRLNAAHRSGKFSEIPADVRSGTRRDAILHAAGANASHGLRRTNADKRRAVEVLLRDEEWRQWTDGAIGKACAVDPKTVGAIRREMVASQEIPEMQTRTVQRGGQTYQQNTANIGSNRPAPAAPERPGAASAMLTVGELKVTVREVLHEVYGDNPEPFALKDMRTGAKMRTGRFWLLCIRTINSNDFRLSDLTQAINDVADQMEQKAAAAASNRPLPEWAQSEPEPEPEAAPANVAQTVATVVEDEPVLRQAQEPADDTRYADLRQWWVRLISLRSDLCNWAELTGRHTETLGLARELTKLLDITQGEMDAITTFDAKVAA